MDAVEYLKTFYKMCDSNKFCTFCEAIGICEHNREKAEQMVEIVKKWGEDHKPKTRQSEFLKMFPNVHIFEGVIVIAPCTIDTSIRKTNCIHTCHECTRKYWTEEITE